MDNSSFFLNGTSLDRSNSSNITEHIYDNIAHSFHVLTFIIISVGLPLTLVAIFAICSLVRKDHVAPIYVVNLLISDLIQFCCMITEVAHLTGHLANAIRARIYVFSLIVTVSFMVCISLERYLVIACPLWYRFRRTIKVSVMVCVLVWVVSLVLVIVLTFLANGLITRITLGIVFLVPCPFLIFFLVGTLRALLASIAVPADEKRRIVGVLVMVVIIYALLFLPVVTLFLVQGANENIALFYTSRLFLRVNPLVDLTFYIFMRKGMIDKLLTSLCCFKVDKNDTSIMSL